MEAAAGLVGNQFPPASELKKYWTPSPAVRESGQQRFCV